MLFFGCSLWNVASSTLKIHCLAWVFFSWACGASAADLSQEMQKANQLISSLGPKRLQQASCLAAARKFGLGFNN